MVTKRAKAKAKLTGATGQGQGEGQREGTTSFQGPQEGMGEEGIGEEGIGEEGIGQGGSRWPDRASRRPPRQRRSPDPVSSTGRSRRATRLLSSGSTASSSAGLSTPATPWATEW